MIYQVNRETQKAELIFDKAEYLALSAEQKGAIKGAYLFSRSIGGWVSRAQFPNLYSAEHVADMLGAEKIGKVGESLTFAEQMERKAERAERMEQHAENAQKRGEDLQSEINRHRGDIAYFTQPNINTSAGRAFTRQREKAYAAYDRGFEEFKKSEYFSERAEAARQTAKCAAPTDKAFCDRRIKEAEKTIKAQRANLERYTDELRRIEQGERLTLIGGGELTRERVEGWIDNACEIIDNAITKVIFYREAIDKLGDINYSAENIKAGYIVEVGRWGAVEVTSAGKVNIKGVIRSGGGADGLPTTAAYSEIKRIIKAEEKKKPAQPWKVGEKITVEKYDYEQHEYKPVELEVVKASDASLTLAAQSGAAIVRRPTYRPNYGREGGFVWLLTIFDSYKGCIEKIAD